MLEEARPQQSDLLDVIRNEIMKTPGSQWYNATQAAKRVVTILPNLFYHEVSTYPELNALRAGSVVLDRHNDPWQRSDETWHSPNPYLAPEVSERLVSLGPFRVVFEA